MFVTPREGLSSLVEAIAGRLPKGSVRLNTAIERIVHTGEIWRLDVRERKNPLPLPRGEGRGEGETLRSAASHPNPLPEGEGIEFDAIIVATPTSSAAKLLENSSPALSTELASIESAGTAIVVFGFNENQIPTPLDSFGFVVPAIENRKILSASFSSVKFPGRAPDGKVLIRVFLGGALQAELLDLDDMQLRKIAEDELRDLLGTSGEPCLSQVYRWRASMPQYHLGHLARLKRINDCAANLPGLALAGNTYEGVGIPQCIRSGEQAAERVYVGIK